MRKQIQKLLTNKRFMELFWYAFFGALSMVVNFVVYFLFLDQWHINYLLANSAAWLAAVLFAYVTNKLWVFHSKTSGRGDSFRELASFIFYRLLSYAMDMGSMYVLLELIHTGNFTAKVITQIIVVIANYAFSKLYIFNRSEKHMKSDK